MEINIAEFNEELHIVEFRNRRVGWCKCGAHYRHHSKGRKARRTKGLKESFTAELPESTCPKCTAKLSTELGQRVIGLLSNTLGL